MKICVFDPALMDNCGNNSANLGDVVIKNAVSRELQSLFPEASFVRFTVHKRLPAGAVDIICGCEKVFVGGSNLIGNLIFHRKRMCFWKQWKLSLKQAKVIGNAILFGVGWRTYEGNTNWYTKKFLDNVLSRDYYHSVRDEYTKQKLERVGFNNVINTHCPTLWPLIQLNCEEIPDERGDSVITMLTYYRRKPSLDMELINLLNEKYKKVYIWPQNLEDTSYIKKLGVKGELLEHSFDTLNNLLKSELNLDYIGTRLHGGVHCLLAKKRSLIVKVDNRASEISRDIGLPTVERENFGDISRWIDGKNKTQLYFNVENIEKWKKQFVSYK